MLTSLVITEIQILSRCHCPSFQQAQTWKSDSTTLGSKKSTKNQAPLHEVSMHALCTDGAHTVLSTMLTCWGNGPWAQKNMH